jgi:hypothetical protein
VEDRNLVANGLKMNRHKSGIPTAKAMDTPTGQTTVAALKEELAAPRFEMVWTITSPTTSSNMAELVGTTPRRLWVRPLIFRTANVVPRLIEHSAAPAANACRGVAPTSPVSMNETLISAPIPVNATKTERKTFDFMALKLVDSLPSYTSSIKPR